MTQISARHTALFLVCIAVPVCEVSAQSGSLQITPDTTLAQVLREVDRRTPAQMKLSPEDAAAAAAYRFAPALHGKSVPVAQTRTCLDFLFGKGWEDSPLAPEDRTNANFMLARCPFRPSWKPDLWVCNNAQWTWRWEKTPDGPDGGTLYVQRAVEDDGDVVRTEPFTLSPLKPEFALNTVLEMIKRHVGTTINVDGNQYVEVPNEGLPDATSRLEPMRVRQIPNDIRARLYERHTVGDFLSLLAAGLNVHTAKTGGQWKWSSSRFTYESGKTRVIYTLRDYAHP